MNYTNIEGWFSGIDARFVSKICEKIHDGIVVELGCYAGKSTAVMAPICKKNGNSYHAIDNFCGADPKDPATRNQRNRNILEVLENNMRSMELLDYIWIHKVDSAAAAQMFVHGEVDFCFIDADHTPQGVTRDIHAWWPKIRIGGTLGGHDYQWADVRRVVSGFAKANQLKLVLAKDKQCWKVVKGKKE